MERVDNGPATKYLIRNTVEIIKMVRKNAAGENFDGLNLRNCCFYKSVCFVGTGNARLSASFRDCKISNQTFLFEGHIGKYTDFVFFCSNSDCILTPGDGEICHDVMLGEKNIILHVKLSEKRFLKILRHIHALLR